MITEDIIKERLLIKISAKNETIEKLAEKLDILPKKISNFLEGNGKFALDTFANLCKILDVDPSYILGITNE